MTLRLGRDGSKCKMSVADREYCLAMDYFAAMQSFVRSVELGSFSKAAAEAGIKVSTVSRYITSLEEDLGAALFNRSTRQNHLTEAGKTFYERASTILVELEAARDETSSLDGRPQGLCASISPPRSAAAMSCRT